MALSVEGSRTALARILVQDEHYSESEVLSIIECMEQEEDDNNNLNALLQDYLGISGPHAESILSRLAPQQKDDVQVDPTSEATSSQVAEGSETLNHASDVVSDEEEELIGPGECELCERFMKLTRHHLIPKSTWSRLEVRIRNVMKGVASDDDDDELDADFGHLRPLLLEGTSRDIPLRTMLSHYTTNICRKCHSHIHDTHDNMTLGISFNTVDKLLADESIYKFAKWASRQRKGRLQG